MKWSIEEEQLVAAVGGCLFMLGAMFIAGVAWAIFVMAFLFGQGGSL